MTESVEPSGSYPEPVRHAGRRLWPDPMRAGITEASSRVARRRPARRTSIPALDGIRAVAVGLVLVDHGGIPGVSGGFIGVDMFFVLSGFLITSLLLDELGRAGRIDIWDFWIRRARRLLPALLVMVLAVGFASELFPANAVTELRDDAVAAFLWVANWSFIAHKTDYFTQGGAPSPLQHTWSLGVEEQYYVIWPLLLCAVVALLAARAGRGHWVTLRTVRLAVALLAAAGALASAVVAVVLAHDHTLNRVYFGTDTRAQALLLGAAAAALVVRDWSSLLIRPTMLQSRWGRSVAEFLPIIGLAGLAALTHYTVGSADEFGHGLLAAAAVAAVAVIAPVALHQRGFVARLLAWRPLVWLGTISYAVYLWHWPIFLTVNGERTGWSGLSLFGVRCAATLVVATASWWLIEQPIRRWRPVRVPQWPLAGATVATAIAVTLLIVPVGTEPGTAVAVSLPPGVAPAAVSLPQTPLPQASLPPTAIRPPVPAGHRHPSGARSVSVFGDSIGWTLMRNLPATPGFDFIDHTVIGCSIVRGGPYRYAGQTIDQNPECDTWPSRWSEQIARDRPDVALLIIGRWETIDRVIEGRWTHIGEPVFDAYLTAELERALKTLSSTGTRLVVTTEPYNRYGEKPNGSLYPEDQPDRVDRWNTLLRRVVGHYPKVELLDLNKKLCPKGVYTAKVDGIKVRSDGVHLTPDGVKWLTPWLEKSVS